MPSTSGRIGGPFDGAFLEVVGLSKSFGRLAAVQDLNFVVPEGGIIGLIGPNGSGKTTTLNLISGFLKPTPERFDIMQAEVQRLQHLVDDLRTLSLADVGELPLRRQPVAPGDLLAQVASAFQHQAEQHKIQLNVEVESGLGKIDLDRERMEQVLENLVSNALRYTPEGGEVRLTVKQAEGSLIVGVEDNGIGISSEIMPHIFERSYRGDPARTGNESGLGLAIAKSIVELHGGSIRAESSPGRGSQFFITVPARSGTHSLHP